MAYLLTVMGWLGETVIKSLIDTVWDKINELGSKGGGGGECGVEDALKGLKNSLTKIQRTITKAENMWIKDKNMRQNVNELLEQLKDEAYTAEDLLDKFQFQKLQQEIKLQGNEASDTSLTHPTKKRKVEEDTGHDDVITEIRKIQEKLDNIQIDIGELLSTDNRENMKKITEIDRITTSTAVETQVFGRDNEIKELMRLLLEPDEGPSGSESSCNIPVLTITGMGGVGKTTLAQQAYNDKTVEEYFKPKIWICVSEHFTERLTKEIIESITKQKCPDLQNLDALEVVLKEKIASKKFLLVLDDVWNEDKHKWDKLCALLSSGAAGSKILVTTRNIHIANMVGSVNPIHLNGLDENSCWAVLKKCAFGLQNSRDHPQLEAIAKKMVPKLKGLPLAARTLGGLLNRNMNEKYWRAIMDSEIWKLPQEEHGVLLVLQLSYWYLPAHLKRCFAFCSVYPKDYEFEEHELVRIWMAEGFFPANENIRMEDFGSVCFQELVSRSFFQKSQRSSRYVMHDLIHDLAQLISGGETYRVEDGKPFEIPTMLRHLNIMDTKGNKEQRIMTEFRAINKFRTLICSWKYNPMDSILTCDFLNKLETVRTLILNSCRLTELPESIGDFIHLRYMSIDGNFKLRELPNSLSKLSNLQALILQSCDLYELPESIGDLIYLRYLDISMNANFNKLPDSLCRLSNLQTLRLCYCDKLRVLPQGMSRLINLRELDAGDNLVSEITGIGKLKYLQSLSNFKVGKEHGRKITELSGLTQLHRTLRIKCLENVQCKEEAIAAKLQSKLHLHELELQWTKNDAFSESKEEVLEHLQPNCTLKRLSISGYSGARSPSWLQSLSKLETLCLEDCKQWDDLSFNRQDVFGSTESNRFLIRRFALIPSSLTRLTLCQVGLIEFPGIQEGMGGSSSNIATVSPLVVRISKCPNLISLDRIERFSFLNSLHIQDCPLLTRLPPLPPSLVELFLMNVGLIELLLIGGSSSNITNVSLSKLWISQCASLTNLYGTECSPCLIVVEIDNCPLLTRLSPLPSSLEKLKLIRIGLTELPGIGGSSSNIATASLSVLRISECASLTNLSGIGCFPYLKSLDIEGCPLLTKLPPLPPSLEELQLNQVGLTEFPGIGGSSSNFATASLAVLRIDECASLTNLGGIECFPCLKSLDIGVCPLLTKLPPLPPSLVELQLIYVGLTEFPGIDESSSNIATTSSVLVIGNCTSLTNLGGIECFLCLKSLYIEDCPLLTRLPPLPPSLEKLQLIYIGLTEFPEIGGSSSNIATASLLVLEIRQCASLTNLGGIECFPCLESLHIEDCPLLTRSLPLPPSLEKLQLNKVGLTEFPRIGGSSNNIATASLSVLVIRNCASLTNLSGIEYFPCLKSLYIEDCSLLTRLPPLSPSLEKLQLIHVGLIEFPGIGGRSSNIATASFSVLEIRHCASLTNLDRIEWFPCLKSLYITVCPLLTRLPPLPSSLVELQLIYIGLIEFPGISGSSSNITTASLSVLMIRNCASLTNLGGIECFPCLKSLHIEDCPLLTRSLPLSPSLEKLQLNKVGLTEFPGIGGSSSNIATASLSVLVIRNCASLTNLDGIEYLPCLKSLYIKDCPLLTRLSPLPPSLEKLQLL